MRSNIKLRFTVSRSLFVNKKKPDSSSYFATTPKTIRHFQLNRSKCRMFDNINNEVYCRNILNRPFPVSVLIFVFTLPKPTPFGRYQILVSFIEFLIINNVCRFYQPLCPNPTRGGSSICRLLGCRRRCLLVNTQQV